MVVAMMLPLVIDALRWTATSSLWRRRHLALSEFLTGYFASWILLGLILIPIKKAGWLDARMSSALFLVTAAGWQLTPWHRRAVVACHRRLPLAPAGGKADLDCIGYGHTIGVSCLVSCWPLMVACGLGGHSVVVMLGVAILGLAERLSFRPPWRRVFLGTLLLAAYSYFAGGSPELCWPN